MVCGLSGSEISLLNFKNIIIICPIGAGAMSVFSARKSGTEVFKSLSLCGVGYTPSDLLSIRQ